MLEKFKLLGQKLQGKSFQKINLSFPLLFDNIRKTLLVINPSLYV